MYFQQWNVLGKWLISSYIVVHIQKDEIAKNMLKMHMLTDLQDKKNTLRAPHWSKISNYYFQNNTFVSKLRMGDASAISSLCSHVWGQANDRAWTEPGDSWNDRS